MSTERSPLAETERAAIERAKAASVAQVMMRCARLLDEVALGRIRAMTGRPIRPAHTALFPHIDLEGTRITEIARRAGISKQAVAPLVSELVQWGWLERTPDPRDGRARLVRFATNVDGDHAIISGLSVLRAVEAELAADLGPDRWATLHGLLTALLPLLEERHRRTPGP